MDLLNGNVKKLFFKYFKATISSSMVMTIYSLVDTICIGQYEGSVSMAQLRGAGNKEEGDKYFGVGMIASLAVSLILFLLYNFAREPFLMMSGGSWSVRRSKQSLRDGADLRICRWRICSGDNIHQLRSGEKG